MRNIASHGADVAAPPETSDRRYVYGPGRPDTDVRRGNRPVRKRKRSPLVVVGLLVILSLGIVLYVWNKITVIRLAAEVDAQRVQYQKIASDNAAIRTEISRKSSNDRIARLATGSLGMVPAKEQPQILEVTPAEDEDQQVK